MQALRNIYIIHNYEQLGLFKEVADKLQVLYKELEMNMTRISKVEIEVVVLSLKEDVKKNQNLIHSLQRHRAALWREINMWEAKVEDDYEIFLLFINCEEYEVFIRSLFEINIMSLTINYEHGLPERLKGPNNYLFAPFRSLIFKRFRNLQYLDVIRNLNIY